MMHEFNLAVFVVSLAILIMGAIFAKIERWPVSEPLIAMTGGIFCGPFFLDLLNLHEWGKTGDIMLIATRMTIAMALMATALRLPANFFRENPSSQSIIVMGGMMLMWLLSTILFAVLFDIPILIAVLAGAIVTPTDPVVASSIVSGRFARNHFSKKIRLTLSFESGANDGLAFPLVALPLLLITQSNPLETWLLKSLLWETVGGIILGYIAGSLAGKLIHTAHDKNWMTEKSLLASSLALAFAIIGGFELLQMNSIIAVFVGGLAFNGHISKKDDLKDEKIQKMMERLFIIPIFFFIGLILPLDHWIREGWILVLLVAAVLLLRRIPAFLLLKILLRRYSKIDILALGWLGPIGVTSVFYVFHAQEKMQNDFLWTACSAVIFGSTFVHGITSPYIGRWYKKHRNAATENNDDLSSPRLDS
jgi:NhaP-type Na+/H+ or K+/H+ antiporter